MHIPWDIIVTVIVAVVGSSGLWEYMKYQSQQKDKSKAFATKAEIEAIKQEQKEEIGVIKRGQMIVLQDRLRFLINKALDNDEIKDEDFRIISQMHDIYNEEGGNSFIDELYNKFTIRFMK